MKTTKIWDNRREYDLDKMLTDLAKQGKPLPESRPVTEVVKG